MSIRLKHIIAVAAAFLLGALSMSAQVDRRDVRAGNRQFRKENWREADIDYRKAPVKDSTSISANYNLASNLYRQGNFDEAAKVMEKIKETAPATANAADYYYNTGDIAIEKKDWQGAVNAFKEALLRNPADMDAKENYIYAKKMLENQKNGGGGQNNDQNNDQNQQNDDKNGQGDQNQDQNQDQQQNQDNNQNQNNQGQNNPQDGQNGQQPVKISPQQAQQMLKAIQAKEKETQDKVNKEKAEALKSRQKDKNW